MAGNKDDLIKRITEIAEGAGRSNGIEIVDVELVGGSTARVLRIYIDKPDGVSHTDCELITRQVGDILDAEDVVPGESYTMEVSSPGVERKLTKPAHFERFAGQLAKVSLREPVENQRFWEGILKGVEGNRIKIEPSEGRIVEIPLEQVRKANLKFEW